MDGEPAEHSGRSPRIQKPTELLQRTAQAVGPAAATMFAETGRDPRLISEITLSMVALYVIGKFLGKYLDGVIEGTGVKDLGLAHGRAVREAAQASAHWIREAIVPAPADIERYASVMAEGLAFARNQPEDARALREGLDELTGLFAEQGLPEAEARRISRRVVDTLWL